MKAKIAVAIGEPSRLTRLLSALSEWLQVNIVTHNLDNDSQAEAQVVFCRTAAEVKFALSSTSRDRLILFRGETFSQHGSALAFSRSRQLPTAFRGQELKQHIEAILPTIWAGETLASSGGAPVWTTFQEQGHRTDFATEALPELQPCELLFDHVHAPKWTGLLPLIAFLRRVTADRHWVSPPLRACMVIDDPNLHWPSYGFINYSVLAHHAKTHGYHVAIATIPLDAWLVHPRVAALFRANTAHLSLLVHGNNHTRNELARSYVDRTREGLVAQSLKRIARLEQILELQISKVMAAPHSACTENLAGELLRQGYEALCISNELVRRFNPTKEWRPSFGLEPAEFLSGGLPVLPRVSLSNKYTNGALLAGFLGQAIIPFGHHEDMADGLNLVTELTGNINRMDGVEWSGLTRIARTNYKHRVSANTLQLQMYSRHIQVNVPKEIERVEVHRPWLGSEEAAESLEVRIDGNTWVQLENGEILLPPDMQVRRLEIRSVWLESVDFRRIPSQSLAPWAIMRRLLTEVRDRCHCGGG